jgi:hypothetical protein
VPQLDRVLSFGSLVLNKTDPGRPERKLEPVYALHASSPDQPVERSLSRPTRLPPRQGASAAQLVILPSNFVLTISSLLAIKLIIILYGRKD